MKVYKLKLILIFLITLSFQALALDCDKESAFIIPSEHWLRQEVPELQYYAIHYLSSKTLHECINEKLPEKRLIIRDGLIDAIGAKKLEALEAEHYYLFDTKSAFHELGINIFDDSFLTNLRAYSFENTNSK